MDLNALLVAVERRALTAAPAPNVPMEWLTTLPTGWNPALNLQDPLIYADPATGRFAALVAPVDACLLDGNEAPGACTRVPDEPDYSYAVTSAVNGVGIAVIPSSLNHAAHDISISAARDHYAHSGSAQALAHYWRDADGVWATGKLLPGLSERELTLLQASALSGDWRWVQEQRRFRMIASQVVNTPGFRRSLSPRQFALAASPGRLIGTWSVHALVAELLAPLRK